MSRRPAEIPAPHRPATSPAAIRRRHAPRGVAILETALALPVLIMLTLGTAILALGVSRYQTMAMLAREGARWASVHGAEYGTASGKATTTPVDVLERAILPRAAGLTRDDLDCTVTWSPDNRPGSTVTVTVSGVWTPRAFLAPRKLSSTSVMTVSY